MKRRIITIVVCILFGLTMELNAQEYENIFNRFLLKLVERNGELGNFSMPDVEVRTAPGMENEALYLLIFESVEDAQKFIAALKKENIPFITFPNNESQIALFYQDIAMFMFKDALGL